MKNLKNIGAKILKDTFSLDPYYIASFKKEICVKRFREMVNISSDKGLVSSAEK